MALTKNQARNNKAVRGLLDIDKLELTDDGVKGLDEQLKAVKAENPYLFRDASEPGKPQFSKPGNPSGSNAVLSKKDIMAEKDASKRIEMIQDNPHLFTNKENDKKW